MMMKKRVVSLAIQKHRSKSLKLKGKLRRREEERMKRMKKRKKNEHLFYY